MMATSQRLKYRELLIWSGSGLRIPSLGTWKVNLAEMMDPQFGF
jgi:hypothetical protein